MLYTVKPNEKHPAAMERRKKAGMGPCRFCGPEIKEKFLYQDTDRDQWNWESHAFVPLNEAQAARLFLLGYRIMLKKDWDRPD